MIAEEQAETTSGDPESTQLLSFLYACPVGLLEMSADGSISMINPMAMQILLRLQATPSMNFFKALEPYAPELRNLIHDFAMPQGTVCENHRAVTSVDAKQECAFQVISLTAVKLHSDRYVISLSDVSTQVRQERKLKEAESWFASLLDGNNDFGVASLDRYGNFTSVSASILRQTGYAEEEFIGKRLDFLDVTSAEGGDRAAEDQLAIAARGGWHLHEDWHLHKDGSRAWYQRLVTVRHSDPPEAGKDDICGYTMVLREGRQRSVNVHKLKDMLTRDYLTGTYNRMHFFEALEKESARKKRYAQAVSLIMVDVDHFKQVNDLHGHAAGDQVLRQFAQVCMAMLRPVDMMARVGGEEFAILVPATDLEGATRLAGKLRTSIQKLRVAVPGTMLSVTGSFGCSELNNACDVTKLMTDADAALYQAKKAGRNCVFGRGVG